MEKLIDLFAEFRPLRLRLSQRVLQRRRCAARGMQEHHLQLLQAKLLSTLVPRLLQLEQRLPHGCPKTGTQWLGSEAQPSDFSSDRLSKPGIGLKVSSFRRRRALLEQSPVVRKER